MNNYISEKAHWQALNSTQSEESLQLLNFLLKIRCKSKSIFISQEALARHFSVCIRTIGRWIKTLRENYFISLKHRYLQTSLCTINSFILKYSEKYKQIFPALRHFTENALAGIFEQNVRHIDNDNINIKSEEKNNAQNLLVFSSSTVKLNAVGGQDDRWTFQEQYFFTNDLVFREINKEINMDLYKTPINQLSDEEWEMINKPSKETKKEIQQQKEELLKNIQLQNSLNRTIKHLDKTEAHAKFAQYKWPGHTA